MCTKQNVYSYKEGTIEKEKGGAVTISGGMGIKAHVVKAYMHTHALWTDTMYICTLKLRMNHSFVIQPDFAKPISANTMD